jgi:glycosyltransferase involved in cell wall biosynthesis
VPYETSGKQDFEPRHPLDFSRGLAKKINILLKNDSLRERFSHFGKKIVKDKFEWSEIAGQTVRYYKTLIGKKPARS